MRPFPHPDAADLTAPGNRALRLVGLFVAELLALAVGYQFFAQIECYRLGEQALCEGLKSLVARAIVVLAVGGVVLVAHPVARGRFLAGARPAGWGWPAVHLFGVMLLFLPLVQVGSGDLGAAFQAALLPWAAGAAAGALGGVFWLAPPRVWGRLASDLGPVPLVALLVAAATPDLAEAIRPIWDWSVLTALTFNAVAVFLGAFGQVSIADAATYVIGMREFAVHISRQCSGVEGFALVTAFVAIYAVIFRQSLWMGRFLLVVLPVALVLSWLLNVVRIGALILVGAHLSPAIAVNGFHSYAGWLFFTLLALGLVAVVQVSPWLHRGRVQGGGEPLRRDPVAATILPFILFMIISTVVAALAPHPDLGYPVKALALLAVVLVFLPAYRGLAWRADPVSLAVGLAIGLGWVLLSGPQDAELASMLAQMTPASLASWIVLRLLGTALLVPLIEEMFFRGYVLTRLDGPGWRRIAAVAVSSLAFAAMHGRWLEAAVAGVAFALLALRSGRVTDAVQAHVAANVLIGLIAARRGDFSLI